MKLPSAAPLLLLPAAAAAKSPISHIVVLMMENRSFDHLLGWLKAALSPTVDGLTEGMTTPRDPNDPSQGTVEITRNGYDVSPDDPKHDFDNIAIQINNGMMDGFVYDSISTGLDETNPVSMFDETSAPIINALASEFAVFDKWYCSIPTSTDPNRQFAMSGTSQGVLTNFNGTLYPQQSYFDYLRENNRSFAGYFQDDLWALGYFADMLRPENAQFVRQLEPKFYNDVASGDLANFVWLQPRMSTTRQGEIPTWQHPDASVREGERLIKQVYEALRAGPKWEETLFLITYDEHGGFYDHVSPPRDGVPPPDDYVASNGFQFDQLGVRIPTIAVSPWIAKGTVVGESLPGEQPTPTSAFESTSVLATANKILEVDAEPLGARMAWANTFASLTEQLSEPRTDCPMTLPDLPAAAADEWLMQRAKPLNEHLVGQLLFYCARMYPDEHAVDSCPGRPELMFNQGQASDWIREHAAVFLKNRFNE